MQSVATSAKNQTRDGMTEKYIIYTFSLVFAVYGGNISAKAEASIASGYPPVAFNAGLMPTPTFNNKRKD